jgi:hypothetical protein
MALRSLSLLPTARRRTEATHEWSANGNSLIHPVARLSKTYHGSTVHKYSKVVASPIGRHYVEKRAHRRVSHRQAHHSFTVEKLDLDRVGTARARVACLYCVSLSMSGIASQAPHEEQSLKIGKLHFNRLLVPDPEVKDGPRRIDIVARPFSTCPST